MKKSQWIIVGIILVLAAVGVFAVAQRGGKEPVRQEVKDPAALRPTQPEIELPEVIYGNQQLPIPRSYYNEDGTVKAGYEEIVWMLEYFGNPVREEKWEEYVAYMQPQWQAAEARRRAEYYENQARKAARGEWDAYAGMSYEEFLEVSPLQGRTPREWAVRVGLIEEDSPRITLEQARQIIAQHRDFASITEAVQAIQPYSDWNVTPANSYNLGGGYYLLGEDLYLLILYAGEYVYPNPGPENVSWYQEKVSLVKAEGGDLGKLTEIEVLFEKSKGR